MAKLGLMSIACSEIHVDYSWNMRKGVGEDESGKPEASLVGPNGATPAEQLDEDKKKKIGGTKEEDRTGENTIWGLSLSLEHNGQDTPIVVRPTPKDGKGLNGVRHKKPFELVSGFRRFKARMLWAERAGQKNPEMMANVKDLSDEQARKENVRENVDRKDVTAADKAFGILQVYEAHKAATGKKMTQADIGNEIGVSQVYAGRLLEIARAKVSEKDSETGEIKTVKLLDKWRDGVSDYKVDDLYKVASTTNDDDRAAAWAELTKRVVSSRGPGGGGVWYEKAKERAGKLGGLLGHLSRLGLIEVNPALFTAENIGHAVACKPTKKMNVTPEQEKNGKGFVAAAALKMFNTVPAVAPEVNEEEEEEGDEEEKKGKGKKSEARAQN